MFDWICSNPELGKVDVCINNAGLSTAETLLDGNVESWKRMLDVNVLALCLCTQLSIKSMVNNNVTDGQIIMISSFSGPGMTMVSEKFQLWPYENVKKSETVNVIDLI